jgi:hypothetical protein
LKMVTQMAAFLWLAKSTGLENGATMATSPMLQDQPFGDARNSRRAVPRAMQQFVEDELLRAPLLFDQLIDSVGEHALKDLAGLPPAQRAAIADMLQALKSQRQRLADYFMRSLRDQVHSELVASTRPAEAPLVLASTEPQPLKSLSLSLVDDETVALDVELAHVIETISSVAEYELRELHTFTSALVGDMDVAADHNPFRADTYARALWAAAQGLAMSKGHQVAFMRHAGPPLAQLLRKSYAASSSRLEAMGIEPAAYRTMILATGSRRGGRAVETTFAPDLHRMVEDMPVSPRDAAQQAIDAAARSSRSATEMLAPVDPGHGEGDDAPANVSEASTPWREMAAKVNTRAEKQALELVGRLFEAMVEDRRVPDDVGLLIALLQVPALRLMMRDSTLLDQSKHPLWLFINRLAFEAEMVPEQIDSERTQLLKVVRDTAAQLRAEPEQTTALYRWAMERLDTYVQMRLTRRIKAVSYRIDALNRLEDKLGAGGTAPSSFHGLLDAPQLDTVPADLMEDKPADPQTWQEASSWLESLRTGVWVRMFLQGRWVHAQLLWPGEAGEVWLFGDSATHTTHTTWAVRRSALLMMHSAKLAKTLKERSIVGSAAARVQHQLKQAVAA